MTPKITTAIADQASEVIRDQIGAILFVEVANQAILQPTADIKATVFVERFAKIDRSEGAVINVTYEGYTELQKDPTMQKNRYTFNVDCYHSGITTPSERGDTKAMRNMQKLLGICRAILNDSQYKTLAFDPPFIGWRSCNAAKIQTPQEAPGALSMVMGRCVIQVDATQSEGTVGGVKVNSWITQVKLEETEKGYIFTEGPTP